MGKGMFSETNPPPRPPVEAPLTEHNSSLELTLQNPVSEPVQSAVPEPEPVQTPFLNMFSQPVPPSQPPAQSYLLEPTLFQFHSLFPQVIPPPQQPILNLLPPASRPCKRARRDDQRTDTIDAPFVWATNRRARVHSFDYLLQKEIFDIKGDVECNKCERKFQISFDVRDKFPEIYDYILKNSRAMNERAPLNIWKNPTLPDCMHCNKKNCVKPIIAEKKKKINWLFLFLGQMLGCCNITQLRYCCKYNNDHRTGAKDRVLYSTYLALCKQLQSV
ncbi:uncharacterized protein LOC127078477 [Lathyrus oleraceus]|uniref:uncharacterized protein LOC127078474 n=1 Tax=Pisum sativum TaxID=3888 RepID=UPI001FC62DCE|nr:uncharacterized protein LOC127078474 [Pisum sativum]XP_050874892.1 uncharacterized protein LOC127078477 [Pisum sativum]